MKSYSLPDSRFWATLVLAIGMSASANAQQPRKVYIEKPAAPADGAEGKLPVKVDPAFAWNKPLLTRAHAHNDYLHARPLLDALDNGFCSVEADIHLVGQELWVAHDRRGLKEGKTLQVLYLDPLRDRVKQYGGHVYPEPREFNLLIDLKTEAETTYAKLREVLKQYEEMLTQYHGDHVEKRAINIIITGNRPASLRTETDRMAALDGLQKDLETNPPVSVVPCMSESWGAMFKWRGVGPMPDDEKQKLKSFLEKAHEQGRKVRFYATPAVPEFWKQELDSGVDYCNVDDLAGFRTFFLSLTGKK